MLAAVGNAAQHCCWGQKQPGGIDKVVFSLHLLWAETSLSRSGSPETQTSQGKVRWRKFWEYCNEEYYCSPFTRNSHFSSFSFWKQTKGLNDNWKIPLPLGCVRKKQAGIRALPFPVFARKGCREQGYYRQCWIFEQGKRRWEWRANSTLGEWASLIPDRNKWGKCLFCET